MATTLDGVATPTVLRIRNAATILILLYLVLFLSQPSDKNEDTAKMIAAITSCPCFSSLLDEDDDSYKNCGIADSGIA